MMAFPRFIESFVEIFTQVLTLAIFARVLLSWFPISRNNPFVEIIFQVTEPILAPLRRVVPAIGFIDLTPMLAILLLYAIGSLIAQVI